MEKLPAVLRPGPKPEKIFIVTSELEDPAKGDEGQGKPPVTPARPAAGRRLGVALAAVALLGAPLASGGVRHKLGAAWAAFDDPGRVGSGQRSEGATRGEGAERSELEGDFALWDEKAPTDPAVEGVVSSLSDLPIPLTQRTMRYVAQFGGDTKGRQTFEARFKRGGRYREHIVQALHDADFPEDLVWLAAVESGFNPQARSPKGAAGLFQFMPDTAARLGLSISGELDERRSITKSTAAAVGYLRFLHDRFGAWDLALAGYNCGEGCVDDAIDKARERLGRGPEEEITFRELAENKLLPKETADFVPQIHAFAIVAHNRDMLGLAAAADPPMRFAELAVPSETKLITVAKAAGLSLDTLQEYNPDLLVDHVPAQRGDFLINVPADALAQTLAALPDGLAKDERERAEAAEKPKGAKTAKLDKKRANKRGGGPVDGGGDAKGDAPAAPAKRGLAAVPGRPDTWALSNGVLIEAKGDSAGPLEIGARVVVTDPLRGRKPTGASFTIAPRGLGEDALPQALGKLDKDLRALVFDKGAPALREVIAARRHKLYDASAPFGPMFEALSARAFPDKSPMHGALLVGTTEPADDMFLEPEPRWALEVTVTLRGRVDPAAPATAAALEAAFADALVSPRAGALGSGGRAEVGSSARHVLVGWSFPALTPKNETATHLAFLLACHNRMGRAHLALRLERPIVARLNCGLELAPQASVAWFLASPAAPSSADDVEKKLDEVLADLIDEGPTDAELASMKSLLRTELAKEVATATLRNLSKSRVIDDNDRILSGLDKVKKADVQEALKALFPGARRVVIRGG